MEQNNELIKVKLFIDKRPQGILQPSGTYATINHSDFFINIPLKSSYKKFEDYISIDKDVFQTKLNRQEFNPYFIELGFFETIQQLSLSASSITYTTNVNEIVESKCDIYNISINR